MPEEQAMKKEPERRAVGQGKNRAITEMSERIDYEANIIETQR